MGLIVRATGQKAERATGWRSDERGATMMGKRRKRGCTTFEAPPDLRADGRDPKTTKRVGRMG